MRQQYSTLDVENSIAENVRARDLMQRKNLEQIRPSKGRGVYESTQYPTNSANPKLS